MKPGDFYVMCVYRNEPEKAFPLFLDPVAEEEALGAIKWQCIGEGGRDEYRLAKIQNGRMIDSEGRVLNVVQGAYTDAAFSRLSDILVVLR